jgi:hypothetical protein
MVLGGLFFLLFVQLSAIQRIRSPWSRLAPRKASFGRVFAWGWGGLLVLWLSAGYEMLSLEAKLLVVAFLLALSALLLQQVGPAVVQGPNPATQPTASIPGS